MQNPLPPNNRAQGFQQVTMNTSMPREIMTFINILTRKTHTPMSPTIIVFKQL